MDDPSAGLIFQENKSQNWIWNWLNDTWLSYTDKSAIGYNIDLSIIL